ncbi:glutamine amidotransferase family protein [Streptomyces sp. WAC 00631]|uniref:class II glutamine amidotransferase n=1 Tax=unclassified Streptomyces TaxID=2593676 RepID=UPI000F795075|nr:MULTISPECIES: glutamine amidotransferase family protein [unclassified Streptomyces]MCC5036491.1 glutamine amidotransferase family protein [Streptomyces sp. WAC 00631]MCC9738360.1 glutamine amidotransferase family protein [Streptomyces sp. MNU89]
MCGIVGLHLREPALEPRLGELLTAMLGQVVERGPDSAGVAVYGDPRLSPKGRAVVSLLGVTPAEAEAALPGAVAIGADATTVVHAEVSITGLLAVVADALPHATVIGSGTDMAVLKGTGNPAELAEGFGLPTVTGRQGVGHTRMATESAVTPEGAHPFSVGPGQCLVHNGSFANHATIRRELRAQGVEFDSENDSEVGARFVAHQLEQGADLEKALRLLCERFDGFYTLLVSTSDSFAVVRDAIACKPALVAETDAWVAMASEYRALDVLPGIGNARIFEPEPEEVYVWRR